MSIQKSLTISVAKVLSRNQNQAEPVFGKLLKGETLKLDSHFQTIHILAGTAWISQNAKDVIVRKGETFRFNTSADAAVLSSLGNTVLVYELR